MLVAERNGTASVPMPVRTVTVHLDEYGYPGWWVGLRLNPRASIFDALQDFDDLGRWWRAFGSVVLEWNFADEDGKPIPRPSEVDSEQDLDLPMGVIGYVFQQYFEAFRESVGLPKRPEPVSANTSSIAASPTSDEKA